MRVWEGQNLGALTILIASLAVYGGALYHDQRSFSELSLPWGDQGSGMITAEVTGGRDIDGIYFLRKKTDIANIIKTLDIEGRIDDAGFAISDGAAISISLAGGEVKISDMPAIRRLALGLPVDLNRASVEELSLIPGIGERMAIEIVQRRRKIGKFTVLSDLTSVPGIKEKKLNSLRKYLTIGSTP